MRFVRERIILIDGGVVIIIGVSRSYLVISFVCNAVWPFDYILDVCLYRLVFNLLYDDDRVTR